MTSLFKLWNKNNLDKNLKSKCQTMISHHIYQYVSIGANFNSNININIGKKVTRDIIININTLITKSIPNNSIITGVNQIRPRKVENI